MQSNKKTKLTALTIFVLFSILIFPASATTPQAATTSIKQAEEQMIQTYKTVLDAESLEADISNLLIEVNEATNLLSKAHMAFDAKNFDDAKNYADSASQTGHEIVEQNKLLVIQAASARTPNTLKLQILSAVAISIVIITSLVVYGVFKRYYTKQLTKMKPRIESP